MFELCLGCSGILLAVPRGLLLAMLFLHFSFLWGQAKGFWATPGHALHQKFSLVVLGGGPYGIYGRSRFEPQVSSVESKHPPLPLVYLYCFYFCPWKFCQS